MFVSNFLSVCVCEVGREGKRQMGRQTRGWWETLMDKDLRTAFRSRFFLLPCVNDPGTFLCCASPKLPIHLEVLSWKMRSRLRCPSSSQWWILKHWLELLVVRMGNGLSGFSHLDLRPSVVGLLCAHSPQSYLEGGTGSRCCHCTGHVLEAGDIELQWTAACWGFVFHVVQTVICRVLHCSTLLQSAESSADTHSYSH